MRVRPLSHLCLAALVSVGASHGALASAQCQQQNLRALEPSMNAQFGFSLSSGDDWLVVGAPLGQGDGSIGGFVHLFERRWNGWHEVQRLAPPASQIFLFYGYCTAVADGQVFVGAPGDPGLISVGAVHVYTEQAGALQLENTLLPSTPSPLDSFGACIGVNASGTTLVVGSAGDDDRGLDAGASYVFERDGDTWVETAKLFASDGAELDALGFPLTIEGDRIFASARTANVDGVEDAGAVYVFERDGDTWIETAKLVADVPMANGNFGTSVDADGDRVLIGGQSVFDLDDPGSAYVFELVGDTWQGTALVPDDPAWTGIGRAVALSGDRAAILGEYRWPGLDEQTFLNGALGFERTESGWQPTRQRLVPVSQEGSLYNSLTIVGDELFFGDNLGRVGQNTTAGRVHRLRLDGDCGITSVPPRVSISDDEPVQQILVHAGSQYAGFPYLVLGSSHGPLPGFDFGGVHVPLNPDDYLGLTLTRFNTGWFSNNFGLLDANGQAVVPLEVGPHPFSVLSGREASHAALVFDPVSSELVHATNQTTLRLVR